MANGIPESVQEQAQEARRKAGQTEDPPESGSEEGEPQGDAPTQEGKEEPAQKPVDQLSLDELRQEQSQPLPASADPDSQEGYWERRFKVVQGLYHRDRAQWDQERRQYEDRIRDLESQLEQARQMQGSSDAPADAHLSHLEETYGSDDSLVQALKAERAKTERLEGQVQELLQGQQQSQESEFWTRLVALTPDWEVIDQRQDFRNWLTQPDPVSGEVRDNLLQQHRQNGNADGAAAIFEAFLSEHPQARAEVRGGGEPPPQEPTGAESQVEPTPSRAEPAHQGNQQMYPYSDYHQFMTDATKGRYSPEEKERLRKEWASLLANGQVDYTR